MVSVSPGSVDSDRKLEKVVAMVVTVLEDGSGDCLAPSVAMGEYWEEHGSDATTVADVCDSTEVKLADQCWFGVCIASALCSSEPAGSPWYSSWALTSAWPAPCCCTAGETGTDVFVALGSHRRMSFSHSSSLMVGVVEEQAAAWPESRFQSSTDAVRGSTEP